MYEVLINVIIGGGTLLCLKHVSLLGVGVLRSWLGLTVGVTTNFHPFVTSYSQI